MPLYQSPGAFSPSWRSLLSLLGSVTFPEVPFFAAGSLQRLLRACDEQGRHQSQAWPRAPKAPAPGTFQASALFSKHQTSWVGPGFHLFGMKNHGGAPRARTQLLHAVCRSRVAPMPLPLAPLHLQTDCAQLPQLTCLQVALQARKISCKIFDTTLKYAPLSTTHPKTSLNPVAKGCGCCQ